MSALATYGYRKGAVVRPGYQGIPPAKPANDNFPWRRPFDPGKPANDNKPRKPQSSASFFRRYAGRVGIAGAALRLYDIYLFHQGVFGFPTTEINTNQYNRVDCFGGEIPGTAFYHYGFIQGRGTSCGTGGLKSETKIEPVAENIVPEWHDSPTQPTLACRVEHRWIRQSGTDPFYIEAPAPAYPNVWPYVAPFPSIAPEELPILQPTPQAKPVPYRFAPYPRFSPNREVGPKPLARPRLKPQFMDGTTWAIDVSKPGAHKAVRPAGRVPPGKGERQKKFWFGVSKLPRLAAGLGIVTEALDFGEVMWQSLPEKFQSRGPRGEPSYPQKLRDVYMHINEVDWVEFWQNYAANEGEDSAFGRLGQLQAAANQNMTGQGAHFGPAL